MKTVKVNIRKPVYGNFCYIRDTYIRQARDKNIPLEITVPDGTATMTVAQWMDGAKRLEKVFKIKNHPMILYGNHVLI